MSVGLYKLLLLHLIFYCHVIYGVKNNIDVFQDLPYNGKGTQKRITPTALSRYSDSSLHTSFNVQQTITHPIHQSQKVRQTLQECHK